MQRLPKTGRAYRAIVDVEMTSHLWHRLKSDIAQTYGLGQVDHALIARVQATSKAKVSTLLHSLAGG
jgi:DNA polymerase-3 subunit epsilon